MYALAVWLRHEFVVVDRLHLENCEMKKVVKN